MESLRLTKQRQVVDGPQVMFKAQQPGLPLGQALNIVSCGSRTNKWHDSL